MAEHIHKIFKFIDPPDTIALKQCIDAIDACSYPWERCLPELKAETGGLVPVVWGDSGQSNSGTYSGGTANLITLNSRYAGINYSFTMLHEAGHMVDDAVLTNQQRIDILDKWHKDLDGRWDNNPIAGKEWGHERPHTHSLIYNDGGWKIRDADYYQRPNEAFADAFVACFAPSYFPYKRFAHWSDDLVGMRTLILGVAPKPPAPAPPKVVSAFPNDSIYRLYRAVFLREPDRGGYEFWTKHRANGASLESVANSFTQSAEFRNRYGALGNEQFVTLLYRNVMNRTPDPGGMHTWTTVLAQGRTRGYVLVGFSESTEFYQKIAAERKL